MTDNRTGTEFRDDESAQLQDAGTSSTVEQQVEASADNSSSSSSNAAWQRYQDEASGEFYWYNSVTGHSQWTEPGTDEAIGLHPITPPNDVTTAPTTATSSATAAYDDDVDATHSRVDSLGDVGQPLRRDADPGNDRVVLPEAQDLVADAVLHARDEQQHQIDHLVELGFSRSESVRALVTCDGDLTRAAAYLFDGGDDASTQVCGQA